MNKHEHRLNHSFEFWKMHHEANKTLIKGQTICQAINATRSTRIIEVLRAGLDYNELALLIIWGTCYGELLMEKENESRNQSQMVRGS